MNNIILITQSFPYMPGEQFLETEVNYYLKYEEISFTIMPSERSNQKRLIHSSIKINEFLINNNPKGMNKYILLIKNIMSKYFYKDIILNNLYNIHKLKILNTSLTKYHQYYKIFDSYFSSQKNLENMIIYTYWHTEITYALQTLKNKYNYKLVSRIHGWDIYQERRKYNYMPLKKQFLHNIDKLFTITESANDYLHNTYGFDYSNLELSRLGVEDKNIVSGINKNNYMHIVSCSFIGEVKRIDKIIHSLKIIANQNPTINYEWTHIGGGELYDSMLNMADTLLKNIKNIKFNFVGTLNNVEVYKFYANHNVDVFINTSSSEGVPVSIMEAMSCSIPIIAPNIGGISDMVINNINGILLSGDCKIKEIVQALEKEEYFKNKNIRNASYNIFSEKYNAKRNYEYFIKELLSLEGRNSVI